MRQRLAIAVSGVAAASVLAVGLSAAGFGPVPRSEANDAASGPTSATGVDSAAEPEVVYVRPAPEPETVVVTKRDSRRAEPARSRNGGATRAARHDDEHEEPEHLADREREHDDDHEEHERDDD